MADRFQAEVIRVALHAAAAHGFVLGGGQALVALGVVDRPTEDIDLFTATDGAVPAAASAVRAALEDAGYTVVLEEQAAVELADVFEGFELQFVEWQISRDDQRTELTLAHLPYTHEPMVLDIGPVMHLDDLLASKVAAAVGRAQPRDFLDVAAATSRYPLERLLAMGRAYDPGLTDEEFTAAARYFDTMPTSLFAPYGLDATALAEVRARLTAWPR
jgi:hypothetical protein